MFQEVNKKLEGETIPYLTMYFVFKGDDKPVIRLVDIDKTVQDEFAMKFRKFLSDNYSNANLVVGNISTADERKYDALLYDIDIISPLDELKKLIENPDAEKYQHSKDKNLKLDGYIFIMGNDKIKIAFYKEHYPMDSISRDSFTLFGRSNSRFVAVDKDEIFKLNNKIDFLQFNDKLYVLNMQVMEANFKIHNVLKIKAEIFITEINKKGFVENPEFINQNIQENPAYARKILKINKNSPVIKLPFSAIKLFVENHPHLNGRLKFNKNDDKISLNTKTSAQLFIKLMDDDFLKSELSQKLYDSIAKDRMDVESEKANSKKPKK